MNTHYALPPNISPGAKFSDPQDLVFFLWFDHLAAKPQSPNTVFKLVSKNTFSDCSGWF